MKSPALKVLLLSAVIAYSPLTNASRKYIAERGDTWESVARKWGLYTEELRADNHIFPYLFTGLEIDLPDNAADIPLSTTAIARLENADRSLELAREKLEARQYSSAASYLGTTVALRGRSAAFVLMLQGRAKDGLNDYEDAFDYYKKAYARYSDGDKTLSEEEAGALSNRMKEVGHLAAEQRLKREEEEARRREERLRERERERAREAERQARAESRKTKQSSGGSSWSGGWGSPWGMPVFGGWGMQVPAIPAPSFQYTPTWDNFPQFNWNAAANSIPINWDTAPVDMGSTYDMSSPSTSTSGNPRDPITFSDHTCGLCGGKGTIIDNGGTTFGLDKTKYCSECGQNVSLSHRHIQCPSCSGKGTVRKRD